MKKLTGPFILAAILMTHVGLLVATEEAYTFSSDDYAPLENNILPAAVHNATEQEAIMQPTALAAEQPKHREF